jgi:hypothetical protein
MKSIHSTLPFCYRQLKPLPIACIAYCRQCKQQWGGMQRTFYSEDINEYTVAAAVAVVPVAVAHLQFTVAVVAAVAYTAVQHTNMHSYAIGSSSST